MTNLLEVAKRSVAAGVAALQSTSDTQAKQIQSRSSDGREVKIGADLILNDVIQESLGKSGIAILSEEGVSSVTPKTECFWVLDPLDGSFNYLRGFGPCSISLAFWSDSRPNFGVIFRLDESKMYWGGKGVGAFDDQGRLQVSATNQLMHSAIATGFPSRGANNSMQLRTIDNLVSGFAKIRMVGSASASLTLLASGVLDAYAEDDIMLWDVAAGLALVQGAGGECDISLKQDWKTHTRATNGKDFLRGWLHSA